ncbi:hypothetical protein Pan216_56800 [Planctomycetes bacterium Pan216]|uniref:Uncharacterized protein n=1 Tax=Kolteria novifilia TaxID=2527975 RepID=A0A518BCT0_9BACT|nr:hypothetical protein Pan216_56800 [Planctomycetes bacterium Pan216]
MLDEAAFVLMAETGEKRQQIQKTLEELQRLKESNPEQAAEEMRGADVSKATATESSREIAGQLSDEDLADICAAGFLAQGLIADEAKGRQEKASRQEEDESTGSRHEEGGS